MRGALVGVLAQNQQERDMLRGITEGRLEMSIDMLRMHRDGEVGRSLWWRRRWISIWRYRLSFNTQLRAKACIIKAGQKSRIPNHRKSSLFT
jgi:hypothetical protein